MSFEGGCLSATVANSPQPAGRNRRFPEARKRSITRKKPERRTGLHCCPFQGSFVACQVSGVPRFRIRWPLPCGCQSLFHRGRKGQPRRPLFGVNCSRNEQHAPWAISQILLPNGSSLADASNCPFRPRKATEPQRPPSCSAQRGLQTFPVTEFQQADGSVAAG